jgi:DNA-binding FrmR family transcriptional regulator
MHLEDVVGGDRGFGIRWARLVDPATEQEAERRALARVAFDLQEGEVISLREKPDPRHGDMLVADGASEPVRQRDQVVQRIHPIGSVAGRPYPRRWVLGLSAIPPGGIIRGAMAQTDTRRDHAADHFRHSYTRDKAQLVRRLARIEGQVRGISRMIEREEYCVDILQQTSALRAAVDSLAVLVLEDHVQGCVRTAAANGEADRYVDEVVDVVRRTLGRPVRSVSRS